MFRKNIKPFAHNEIFYSISENSIAPTDTESIQIHITMECERIVKMVIKVIAMKFYECLNQFSVNIRSGNDFLW